jgi:hypothetical protein
MGIENMIGPALSIGGSLAGGGGGGSNSKPPTFQDPSKAFGGAALQSVGQNYAVNPVGTWGADALRLTQGAVNNPGVLGYTAAAQAAGSGLGALGRTTADWASDPSVAQDWQGGYANARGLMNLGAASAYAPQYVGDASRLGSQALTSGTAALGQSGMNSANYDPMMQGAMDGGQGMQNTGWMDLANSGAMSGAGNAVLNTAFDPQGALYNRTLQRLNDQVNVGLEGRGLNTSGAGQGIANDALSNFNIDWQNNQLQRQATGIGAGNSAFGGANALGMAGGQGIAQGAALPYQTQMGALGDQTRLGTAGYNLGLTGAGAAQNAQNQVVMQGLGALSTGAGVQGAFLGNAGQGTNLGYGGYNQQLAGGAMPFNAYQNVSNGGLGALGQYNTWASGATAPGNTAFNQIMSLTGAQNRTAQQNYGNWMDQNAASSAGLQSMGEGLWSGLQGVDGGPSNWFGGGAGSFTGGGYMTPGDASWLGNIQF